MLVNREEEFIGRRFEVMNLTIYIVFGFKFRVLLGLVGCSRFVIIYRYSDILIFWGIGFSYLIYICVEI